MDYRSWSSISGAFTGEIIPFLDSLPFWTIEILYLWSINNEGIAASAVSQTIGLKGGAGAIKAPTGSTPPVISTYGKTPPKIEKATLPPIPSQGATPPPLPRRIPPEPGIGDEPRPPILRQGPPPIPQKEYSESAPPVIETYEKTPPELEESE